MNFREWIFNELVHAREIGYVYNPKMFSEDPVEYKIYKDPTPQELKFAMSADQAIIRKNYNGQGFPSVRGILTPKKEVYIWPGTSAAHGPVRDKLKVRIAVAFEVDNYFSLKKSDWTSGAGIKGWEDLPEIKSMFSPEMFHA